MEVMLKFEGAERKQASQRISEFTGFHFGDKQKKETSGTCQSTSPGPNGSGFRDHQLLQVLVMNLIALFSLFV